MKVALVVKDSPSTREREKRNMGYWSYAVPGLSWDHYGPEDLALLNRRSAYDLVVIEDVPAAVPHPWNGAPLVYVAIDSTLSQEHYEHRLETGLRADLVLIDHDRLERWRSCRMARRWNYCINDRLFVPGLKTIDVVGAMGTGKRWNAPGADIRTRLRQNMHEVSALAGWSFVSSTCGIEEYAALMGKARVVINWPRTTTNRPHRVMDAMACQAVLVTGAIPHVEGDNLDGCYVELPDIMPETLEATIRPILEDLDYQQRIAGAGYNRVMAEHTWAVRAQQFLDIVQEVF